MKDLSTSDGINDAEAMIRRMNLIYFAIISGIIVFTGICFYLVQSGREVSAEIDDAFKILVPLLAVAGTFASRFVYSLLVKKAAAANGSERLSKYQTAVLVRLATLEAPCLFSIVAYLMTGNSFYLIVLSALLILILLYKPNMFRYKEETGS